MSRASSTAALFNWNPDNRSEDVGIDQAHSNHSRLLSVLSWLLLIPSMICGAFAVFYWSRKHEFRTFVFYAALFSFQLFLLCVQLFLLGVKQISPRIVNPIQRSVNFTAIMIWSFLVSLFADSSRNVLVAISSIAAIFGTRRIVLGLISDLYHRKSFDAKMQKTAFAAYVIDLLRNSGRDDLENLGDSDDVRLPFLESKLTFAEFVHQTEIEPNNFIRLQTKQEAISIATAVFQSIKSPNNDFVNQDDFQSVFLGDQATRDAFAIFNLDCSETLSRSQFKEAMIQIFKERCNLIKGLENAKSALESVDWLLLIGSAFLAFVAVLGIFEVNTQNLIASAFSTLIVVYFALNKQMMELISSILFVFVAHPFDIGDQIKLSDESLTVEKIGLSVSTLKNEHGEFTYMNNHALAEMPITNLTRSDEQWKIVPIELSTKTSYQQQEAFRELVKKFVADHAALFSGEFKILPNGDTFDVLSIKLMIEQIKTNDPRKALEAHTALMSFVSSAIRFQESHHAK